MSRAVLVGRAVLTRAMGLRAAPSRGVAAVPGAGQPTWPPVPSPRATDLRSAWYRRSLETSWTSAGDWWDPACDAVVEAVVSGRDVRPAVRRLGCARARLGVAVEETMDDVLALWRVHVGGEPPARVLQDAAAGWAEAGLEPAGAASCFDAMTGLATRAHLEARLGELYRSAAHGGVVLRHQLVILDVGPVAGTPAADPSTWRQVEGLYRCVEAIRRVFTSGETLSRLTPGRLAALAECGPDLVRRLGALDALLAAGAVPDVAPSVWVESLPRTFGMVPQLLADLAR